MGHLKILSLLLLGCCAIVFVCSESVPSADKSAEDDAAVTLSTELLPPPLPAEGEHRGIVYLINLFAVRNKIDVTPEDKKENVLPDDSPRIIGPLASILLVVDADDVDDEEITFDDLTIDLLDDDSKLEGVSSEEKAMAVKTDLTISEESNVTDDKPKKLKKTRRKRTLFHCKTCGGGGGGGGGGGYGGGYGGGQQVGVLPVVVVPIGIIDGNGGRREHGGGGYYPNSGGGGGNVHLPNNNGGYPNGGGYPGQSGWGNGGGASYSEASSQSRSYNYGG